jgi:hypothetical protein
MQDIAESNILIDHKATRPRGQCPEFRSLFPVRYYFIDFEYSIRFPQDSDPATRLVYPIEEISRFSTRNQGGQPILSVRCGRLPVGFRDDYVNYLQCYITTVPRININLKGGKYAEHRFITNYFVERHSHISVQG